jgi:hypothetical protein
MMSPYVLGGIILGSISIIAGDFLYGHHEGVISERAKWEKTVVEATQKAAAAQKAQDAISLSESVKQAQAQQLVQHTFDTIEKKVPIYVTKIDRNCHLSVGVVRVWNAAVAGADSLPDAAGQSDADASAVTAADALNNAVTNFATYHQTAERLSGLQDWIKQQENVK